MNKNEQVLAAVRIASPCNARWEDMDGDDRKRFCHHCSKNVYNFSEMSASDVGSLIKNGQGNVCARFYRRADGTMLTADCPLGLEQKKHPLKRLLAAAAACLCLGGLSAFAQSVRVSNSGKSSATTATQPNDRPGLRLGEICIRPSTNHPPFLGKIAMPPRPATNSVPAQK